MPAGELPTPGNKAAVTIEAGIAYTLGRGGLLSVAEVVQCATDTRLAIHTHTHTLVLSDDAQKADIDSH